MKYIILWYNFELLKAGIIINGVNETLENNSLSLNPRPGCAW